MRQDEYHHLRLVRCSWRRRQVFDDCFRFVCELGDHASLFSYIAFWYSMYFYATPLFIKGRERVTFSGPRSRSPIKDHVPQQPSTTETTTNASIFDLRCLMPSDLEESIIIISPRPEKVSSCHHKQNTK